MKRIYNLFILLAAVVLVAGCSEDFLDINENPNVASSGAPNLLLTSAQVSIAGQFNGGLGFGGSVYARQRYGLGTSTYAITAATYQGTWQTLYSAAMKDLREVMLVGEAEENQNLGYAGVAKILMAYVNHQLVDYFGDIPYDEALQGETIFAPVFEDDAAVYDKILLSLDEAIANLDAAIADNSNIQGDLMYGNDLEEWIKAANTLKIKMFLNIGNVDATRAAAGITAVLTDGRIIDEVSEDWQMTYTDIQVPNNRHTTYTGQYDGSPGYLDNFFMLRLVELGDPRIRYYFYRQARYGDLDFDTTPCSSRTDCDTWTALEATGLNYIGRDHGDPSGLPGDDDLVTVPGLYPIGGKFDNASYRTVNQNSSNPRNRGAEGAGLMPLLTSSMTHFMLAEANLTLGVATPVSAADHFDAGMQNSFDKVRAFAMASIESDNVEASETARGFDYAAEVGTYIAGQLVGFNNGTQNEQLNLIMIQKNIASWGNGMEPYTDLRRTGFPNDFPASLAPQGPFPLRVLYPNSEISANPNAPQTVIPQSEPIFWDN